jgi:hypothetical protein
LGSHALVPARNDNEYQTENEVPTRSESRDHSESRQSQQPHNRLDEYDDYDEVAQDYRHEYYSDMPPTPRLSHPTDTLSGIYKNYQHPNVGVAGRPDHEVQEEATFRMPLDEQRSDITVRGNTPLLDRSDSRHVQDFYNRHGYYPPSTFTDSELETHVSGEDLLYRSSESDPALPVNTPSQRLPANVLPADVGPEIKSTDQPQPTRRFNSNAAPSAVPGWFPPPTPDTPKPLFSSTRVLSSTFSNTGPSYTSTNRLLDTQSPPRRLEQPPSSDWPLKTSQPLPRMEEDSMSQSATDRQIASDSRDIDDMRPFEAPLTRIPTRSSGLPIIWTERRGSGPDHLRSGSPVQKTDEESSRGDDDSESRDLKDSSQGAGRTTPLYLDRAEASESLGIHREPRRHDSSDKSEDSYADLSDNDPAQPRQHQASFHDDFTHENSVRNSGKDWVTEPDGASFADSVPDMPPSHYIEDRARDATRFESRIAAHRDSAPGMHNAPQWRPTSEDVRNYVSRGSPGPLSPYYMQENWSGSISPAQAPQGYSFNRPVFVANEDLSPEPHDTVEYDEQNPGYDQTHHRQAQPVSPTHGGPIFRSTLQPQFSGDLDANGPVAHSSPQNPADAITAPAEAYFGGRPRGFSRSDGRSSSFGGSHRKFSHAVSTEPLVSRHGFDEDIEMGGLRGARRYSSFRTSHVNPARRSVAGQTDLRPLQMLSPANRSSIGNFRHSTTTQSTSWGGFLHKLTASGHRDGTPPPIPRIPREIPRPAARLEMRRQESSSFLLPGPVQKLRRAVRENNAYGFSVGVLCFSSVFIIFLPLYFWGQLDTLIQKYTNGVVRTYPKKLKWIAGMVFVMEISCIFVAAVMGGTMGKH